MSESLIECLWYGDCPNCGPEGELVAVAIQPSSLVCLKCLECATMFQAPGKLSLFESLAGGLLRPATRGDVAGAGWSAEPKGTIMASKQEIEYLWGEAK